MKERYESLYRLAGFTRASNVIKRGRWRLPDGSRLSPEDRYHYETLRSLDWSEAQIGLTMSATKIAVALGISETAWYATSKRLQAAGLITVNSRDPQGYYVRWNAPPLEEVVYSIFWRYWLTNVDPADLPKSAKEREELNQRLSDAFDRYWAVHGNAIEQNPDLYVDTWRRNNSEEGRKLIRASKSKDPLVVAGFLLPGQSLEPESIDYDEYPSIKAWIAAIGGLENIPESELDEEGVPYRVGRGIVTIGGIEFPEITRDEIVLAIERRYWDAEFRDTPNKRRRLLSLIETKRGVPRNELPWPDLEDDYYDLPPALEVPKYPRRTTSTRSASNPSPQKTETANNDMTEPQKEGKVVPLSVIPNNDDDIVQLIKQIDPERAQKPQDGDALDTLWQLRVALTFCLDRDAEQEIQEAIASIRAQLLADPERYAEHWLTPQLQELCLRAAGESPEERSNIESVL